MRKESIKTSMYILSFVSLFVLFLFTNRAECDAYLIGDEDVLKISVWGNQELSVQVPVRPDGMISFPLVGDVKARGVEPQQLKATLENELSKFVKMPTVSVLVAEINSFKVYILKGVSGLAATSLTATSETGTSSPQGVITLRRDTTLMQLLAQLGSLGWADLHSAYVLRDGKKLDNDISKLILKGDISQDIQLKPNDLIFIPDSFDTRIMVLGAVKTPTVIRYREGLTVLDAILGAGGFTEFANQNNVIVVRREGGRVSNIEMKVKDIIKEGDINKDLLLKPGDHIVVKTGIF